jgi:hypothetical protein
MEYLVKERKKKFVQVCFSLTDTYTHTQTQVQVQGKIIKRRGGGGGWYGTAEILLEDSFSLWMSGTINDRLLLYFSHTNIIKGAAAIHTPLA